MSDQFETRSGGERGGPTGPARGAADEPDPADGLDEPEEVGVGERSAAVPTGVPASDGGGPGWAGALTGAGLGLVVVQALVLIGTFAQGMAVGRFQGDFFHKIGVALLSNVGSANGLTLLVAAVLAGLPSLLGARVSDAQRSRQALVFGLGGVLAVLLVLGTPLAVRARIHVLDVGGQAVDSLARRVLATYVAGTLGTALVALGACLGLSRHSKTVTPRP